MTNSKYKVSLYVIYEKDLVTAMKNLFCFYHVTSVIVTHSRFLMKTSQLYIGYERYLGYGNIHAQKWKNPSENNEGEKTIVEQKMKNTYDVMTEEKNTTYIRTRKSDS